MKIINFIRHDGQRGLGFSFDNQVLDPLLVLEDEAERKLFADTLSFIQSGIIGRRTAERLFETAPQSAWLPLDEVTIVAPITPSTLLCSGSNYQQHNLEKANTPISGKEPEFFVKTSDCVIGPGEAIIHDARFTKKLDCEVELAIVIGRPGRHIPVEQALDHVFGYTIVNDVTARDRQVRTSPNGLTWYDLGRGKAFDTSAPLGPCIVTTDEIRNPQSLSLRTWVNGELRQASNTDQMIWSCAELIHFFSINFTLKPGMVILTGTPAGTAWSTDAELGGKWHPQPGLVPASRYCLPGDIIECEIETIGVLRNRVKSAEAALALEEKPIHQAVAL